MAIHQFEQVEELDDYDFGFGTEISFERIYSRRDRRPPYARRIEQFRKELALKQIYRARREVATTQNRQITADVSRALAASGLDDRIVGVDLGVTTLTAIRAIAIFKQNYAPYHSRAEAAKKFNHVVRQKSQAFNQSNPRPEVVLGSISIYGLNNRNRSASPIGLYCQVEDTADDLLVSEYQEMVAALRVDSRRPIKLSPALPHITLASFGNRIIAERFAERLDTINDMAALSGRLIVLDQVRTKGVFVD